jgi:serine/threonine-protein kinase RsbW
MGKKETITIINKVDELPILAGKMEELAEKWGLPMDLTMNLNLVLEEAVSNVIFYAFKDKEEHEINIMICRNDHSLVIEIHDEGVPFDPTLKQKPDLTLPVEERPIGGLGIFLISKIMDNVSYKRIDNENVLTLTKNI